MTRTVNFSGKTESDVLPRMVRVQSTTKVRQCTSIMKLAALHGMVPMQSRLSKVILACACKELGRMGDEVKHVVLLCPCIVVWIVLVHCKLDCEPHAAEHTVQSCQEVHVVKRSKNHMARNVMISVVTCLSMILMVHGVVRTEIELCSLLFLRVKLMS